MITEHAIQEAIAYCNGKLDPNRSDAILLAACYILQDHIAHTEEPRGYSEAAQPETFIRYRGADAVGDYGDSEFLRAIAGRDQAETWSLMDELMSTLRVANERLYNGVMHRLQS